MEVCGGPHYDRRASRPCLFLDSVVHRSQGREEFVAQVLDVAGLYRARGACVFRLRGNPRVTRSLHFSCGQFADRVDSLLPRSEAAAFIGQRDHAERGHGGTHTRRLAHRIHLRMLIIVVFLVLGLSACVFGRFGPKTSAWLESHNWPRL